MPSSGTTISRLGDLPTGKCQLHIKANEYECSALLYVPQSEAYPFYLTSRNTAQQPILQWQESFVDQLKLDDLKFGKIVVWTYDSICSLIPSDWENASAKDILSSAFKDIPGAPIHSIKVDSLGATLVFQESQLQTQLAQKDFELELRHLSEAHLSVLSQSEHNDVGCWVVVEGHKMEVLIFQDKAIRLHNFFDFTAPEDFVYYLLNAFESTGLNPESTTCNLLGDMDEDSSIFKLCRKYIRNIECNPATFLPKEFKQGEHRTTLFLTTML